MKKEDYYIMKKTCHNGLLIQLKIRKDDRYTERMNDIGLSGFAELSQMSVVGVAVGFADFFNVGM